MPRTIESTLGFSRRILNLIVGTKIPGIKSLCCIDLNRQKFFHPTPSTTTIGAGSEMVAAGASETQTPPASDTSSSGIKPGKTAATVMEKFRLRNPTFSFKAEGEPDQWNINYFPLADRKVICADQFGCAFLFDADSQHVTIMPNLHKSKWMPISVFLPNKDADQGGDSTLYIMEGVPKPEAGCCTLPSDQFEALVYRKPTDSWHSELLPPPPFVRDPTYRQSRHKIESYAVVSGGSHICISTKEDGTYSLDTANRTWSKVSEWTLPFIGKAEYVPELKLWLGLAAESGHLAAADLSTIFTMDSQPQLVGEWKELDPPVEWIQIQDSQLVNLGFGRFCIARLFQDTSIDFDELIEQRFLVLTCVEVKRAHDGNPSHGQNGKDELEITMFKPRCIMCGATDIDVVF